MIRTRKDLKQYIRTALGEPVIHVDVTEQQLDDRIDEAIDFFQQYHADGTVRCYLKQRITASEIHVREPIQTELTPGGIIRGVDSGATATIEQYPNGAKSNNYTIFCSDVKKDSFTPGEKIHVLVAGHDKNNPLEFTFTNCVLGIIDEKEIQMPPHVIGVIRIFPVCQASSTNNLFNNQYQMMLGLDLMRNITDTSIVYYEQAMEHLNLLDFELNPAPQFEYNRHENIIVPQMRWKYDASVGDYIIMECFRVLDPKKAPGVWNDIFLKRYSIALTKRQWGINLSKYNGMQLPGGATLNGSEIYQQAVQEIQQLEDQQMQQLPPSAFFIG